jgi:gliding motility-associated-like protein
MKKYFYVLLLSLNLVCFSQDIDIFKQFNGRYSYTAIGNTLNPAENNLVRTFCEILPESSATLNLNSNQNIISAYIYWAGSGSGDKEVALNGTALVADETFLVDFNDSLDGTLTYFSCLKDITSFIKDNGSITYTLSNLDIADVLSTYPGYCNNRTNFAGWAIFVIYEEETLPLNQVSIYHGLEIINTNKQEINIEINNLNVLDNVGAKMGFLAWEGDNSLNYGESLIFNNTILESLPLNPGDNAFNGTNTFVNSSTSYNMDLDVYDVGNYIAIGDDSASVSLTTGEEIFGQIRADLIIINNIVTVLNSQLPDATINISNVFLACDNKNIEVEYTVYNSNSTKTLPANTPISFYIEDVLVANAVTEDEILIDEFESGRISILLPDSIATNFILRATVDDVGNGIGIVDEVSEINNNSTFSVELLQAPVIISAPDIQACDEGFNSSVFDLTTHEDLFDLANNTVSYYRLKTDAENRENEIIDVENYKNTSEIETIYVRIDNDFCFQILSFNLIVINCKPSFIPSGFSPNNDGVNDFFEIAGLLNIFENFELKIFNRYGTLIYQGGNELSFWNGRSNKGIGNNGELLPVGTYYYALNLNDPNYKKPLTGWVYVNY